MTDEQKLEAAWMDQPPPEEPEPQKPEGEPAPAPEPAPEPEAEPVAEGEPAAEPPAEEAAADPYEKYRATNGKYFGRYDTVEAALDGLKTLDEARGREAQERGQLREQAPPQPQGGQPVDPLTQQLEYWQTISAADPEELRQYEQFAQMSDVQILRLQQRADRETERIAAQVQQVQQGQQITAALMQADEVLFSQKPDLVHVASLVQEERQRLFVEAQRTGKDWPDLAAFNDEVEQAVRQRIAPLAGYVQQQAPPTLQPQQAPPPRPQPATLAGGSTTVGNGRGGNVNDTSALEALWMGQA